MACDRPRGGRRKDPARLLHTPGVAKKTKLHRNKGFFAKQIVALFPRTDPESQQCGTVGRWDGFEGSPAIIPTGLLYMHILEWADTPRCHLAMKWLYKYSKHAWLYWSSTCLFFARLAFRDHFCRNVQSSDHLRRSRDNVSLRLKLLLRASRPLTLPLLSRE